MPKKPKSDCPLFPHQNGQWCKKIRGKPHYFGTDKDAALKKWAAEKDYLLAGVAVPRKDPSPTLAELGNVFHDRLAKRVERGEISQRSLDDYTKTINRLIDFVGKECRPERLRPADYASIKDRLFDPIERTTAIRGGLKGRAVERRSPTTVAGDVRRIRAFLNWCYKNELIEVAPRYGTDFSPITEGQARKVRQATGPRDLSAKDVRAIIDAAPLRVKPLFLLAINGAVGNRDLANIRLDQLPKLEGDVWLDLPRGKTGSPRRFQLWPETRDAITAYLPKRPSPAGSENANRVFLTRVGLAWVRRDNNINHDSLSKAFTITRDKAGVARGSLYDLRRTFRTVADEVRDTAAIQAVMGHAASKNDMDFTYRQRISDDRLRAVCEHVRAWLFGNEAAKRVAG